MISYAVIFVYIAVALGEYSSWKRIMVRIHLFKGEFQPIQIWMFSFFTSAVKLCILKNVSI